MVATATGALVGLNTGLANRIVADGLAAGQISGLPQSGSWRPEVAFGTGTRFDFCHSAADGALTFLEVKSVTLSRRPGLAEFPDARTERGAKHLRELMAAKALGHRAVLLFLVQRADCRECTLPADIDPAYAASLAAASMAAWKFWPMPATQPDRYFPSKTNKFGALEQGGHAVPGVAQGHARIITPNSAMPPS